MIDLKAVTGVVGVVLAALVFVLCILGMFSVIRDNQKQGPDTSIYFLNDEHHFVSAKFVSMNEVDWSEIVNENGEVIALVSDGNETRAIWVKREGDYWKIKREKTKEPLTNEE